MLLIQLCTIIIVQYYITLWQEIVYFLLLIPFFETCTFDAGLVLTIKKLKKSRLLQVSFSTNRISFSCPEQHGVAAEHLPLLKQVRGFHEKV